MNIFVMPLEIDLSLKTLVTTDGDAAEGLVVDMLALVGDTERIKMHE